MVKLFAAKIATFVVAFALSGVASAVDFLRDFTIALPPDAKAAVRLVVPPVSDAVLDKSGPFAPLFAVGPGDAVWFSIEPGVLIDATKRYRFRLDATVSDITVINGGMLLIATDDALGFFTTDIFASGKSGNASGQVAFQPIVTSPVSGAHLSPGANGSLYLFGAGREDGRYEVFLLAPEATGSASNAPRMLRTMRKVFSTTERIAAVAGDGEETFVASGRLIVKVSAAKKGMTAVLLHPKEEILGLARTRNGLLFYATSSGVGVVSPSGAVEFVKAPNVVLRSVGDDLYLLLRNSFAVVKVEGTVAFRTANPSKSTKK